MHETKEISRPFRAFAILVLSCSFIGIASTAPVVAQTTNILGLKILNEKVPAGGMLQMKLTVTEPKPILTSVHRSSALRPASISTVRQET